MEIKIKQLSCVIGGSFMETIKKHSRIAMGVGIGICLLTIGGIILFVAIKKKRRSTAQFKGDPPGDGDWEFISSWFRNEKGELMIWV